MGVFLFDPSEDLAEILKRAVARGEVRADVDVELVADLLVGPLFMRFLVFGGTLSSGFVRALIPRSSMGFVP